MSLIILNVDEVRRTLSASGGAFVVHDKEVDIVRFAINSGFADIVLDGQVALRVMYQRPGETEVRAQTLTYYDTDGLHNYYDWQLSQSDLAKNGSLTVALCILDISGGEVSEWHTTPCVVRVLSTIHTDDSDEGDDTITPTVKERVAVLESMIQRVASGAPIVVASTSAMTDTDQIYVLSTNGNWYYHNGSAWTVGGEYGGVATDTTLSQSGMPADAKAVGDKLSAINESLGELYIPSANIYNQATDRHGTAIDENGNITANASFKVSDYIYIGSGNHAIIQRVAEQQYRVFYYGSNDASSFKRSRWFAADVPYSVSMRADENYIVIMLYETCPDFMVNLGDTLLPYEPYGATSGPFLQGKLDEVDGRIDTELENVPQKSIINRFDKTTIASGYYLGLSVGALNASEDFFASDYIDVSDLANVKCSYTHIVCFYDENKAFVSGQGFNTINTDGTIAVPDGATYLRFSTYLTHLDTAQIGANVDRRNYMSHDKYTLLNMVVESNEPSIIVVDISGNGDYTSFTEAVYNNVDNGKDIIVKAGTYDIKAEYIALFGQDVVDNLADATSGINNFQYGIRLHDRKVTFEAGSHLVCDWTGKTVNGTHRFCALRIEPNAELIGLDLDCTNTFYCIHDDYGTLDNSPYTVTYKNCRVIGRNLYNANCIGGGAHKYSRHILDNCYFNNGVSSSDLVLSADVRYHNTNTAGAEPELYVSNCYFSNNMNVTYYGTQTTKMRAYINNCYAPKGINKRAESSSATTDNVELYTWNIQGN